MSTGEKKSMKGISRKTAWLVILVGLVLAAVLDPIRQRAFFSLSIAAASFAFGALWLSTLLKHDRWEPEPLKIVLGVGFLGGLLSAFAAGYLNGFVSGLIGGVEDDGSLLSAFFYLFVGFNEEFWKLFFTILLVARLKEFDEPVDGLIYALSVGLGFAVVENTEYAVMYGPGLLLTRNLISVPIHLGCSMIWALGLTRAHFLHDRQYFRPILPYYLAAAVVHGLFDVLVTQPLSYLVTLGGGLLVAFVLMLLSRNRLRAYAAMSPFAPRNRCGHCGGAMSSSEESCSACGKESKNVFYKRCPTCGVLNARDRASCRFCRHGLE